ncbi:unnamed protein product [Sphenostylis stenocarpa]|uniref:Uncharacterized protein n=1 Tax=Sphenostylis stenocarpa TaxID=92480 RepID=A0AA86SKT1_9FABA|nr:unnamed protein product [Sphenostylis stenocarpa]
MQCQAGPYEESNSCKPNSAIRPSGCWTIDSAGPGVLESKWSVKLFDEPSTGLKAKKQKQVSSN